jgi:hypothetical protein
MSVRLSCRSVRMSSLPLQPVSTVRLYETLSWRFRLQQQRLQTLPMSRSVNGWRFINASWVNKCSLNSVRRNEPGSFRVDYFFNDSCLALKQTSVMAVSYCVDNLNETVIVAVNLAKQNMMIMRSGNVIADFSQLTIESCLRHGHFEILHDQTWVLAHFFREKIFFMVSFI